MKPSEAIRLCARAADQLQAAHDRNVIHGDLRPSDLREELAGFGRAADEASLRPGHRSPEQLFSSPEEVDARTDIYSLGSVLYELLTGRPPFDTLARLELEEPAPPGISKAVDAAVLRALAKEPAARFATARDFAAALRAAAPRPKAWLLAVPAAAGVVVFLLLAIRPTPPAAPPRATAAADPRLPWLTDAPADPAELFPIVRELALEVPGDPARVCGEILGRVGPMRAAKPASPGPHALMGVAHVVHGNRRLARDYFAQARARRAPGAELGRDPVGALLAADSEDRFEKECDRFLGGIRE